MTAPQLRLQPACAHPHRSEQISEGQSSHAFVQGSERLCKAAGACVAAADVRGWPYSLCIGGDRCMNHHSPFVYVRSQRRSLCLISWREPQLGMRASSQGRVAARGGKRGSEEHLPGRSWGARQCGRAGCSPSWRAAHLPAGTASLRPTQTMWCSAVRQQPSHPAGTTPGSLSVQ